jgi:hypothetical protein
MYMLDDLADVGAATGAAAGPAAKALPIITFHLPMRGAAAVVPNGVCAAWLWRAADVIASPTAAHSCKR